MEAAASVGRSVSVSQSPSRKEWRVVSDHPVRNAGNEDLERSKLGHSDERTIYEQGQDGLDGVDFCSIQMDGIMGVDDGIFQQKIHNLARQREELQQMEVELRAQMIAKSEIMEMQDSFDARFKEQDNVAARLEEQLREREQRIHELERKMEEKERELHAIRLDNQAAWAKEDLLREQNKELENFRRERDNIDAERAHHIKQIHDLQEHIQDKERQLLELQEQHRIAQETILYKDEQIREAQAWMARVQEIDVLQSSTLQAELRERTEQYNQLWLGCQRQFAEMERVHMQAIQQLQLELSGVRGKSGTYNSDSSIAQNPSSDGSQIGPNSGNKVEANGGSSSNGSSGGHQNGNSENSQQFASTGNASSQASHVPSLPISPSPILGMPSYMPPGQVTAVHPYVMHQQGAHHSVPLHVPNSHVHFHSLPAMASSQQWQNQQAVQEGPQMSQNQYSRNEENLSRSESNYGYDFSVNGPGMHADYLHAHMSQGLDHNSQMSSTNEAQALESTEKSYLVGSEAQHNLQQISSHFHEALRLEPLNQTNEIEENNAINAADNGPESQDVMAEQTSSVASPSPSEATVNHIHFREATVNNTADSLSSEVAVSTGQTNSLSIGKIPETPLLDERALLACIVRTIPAGGKIRISSTLPNRLAKMLAPLHWHDYKKRYGKLDDFVASHPELFVIEEDYIQLREGAQGIIAATAAVAKVAAAAAASSPFSPFFPSVAVTPMAHASRVKKNPSMEAKPVTHSSSHHTNGPGFSVSGGGISNMKILSKSRDSLELNGSEFRPAENGAHSDRSHPGNLQSKVQVPTRTGASFVGKQQGRTTSAQMASRR